MTKYLLDTNVLSETRRRLPNENVLRFLDSVRRDDLYTSAIAIAELHLGAERKLLQDIDGGERIARWIDALERRMSQQILLVDGRVAAVYGKLQRYRDNPIMDTLLAATAITYDLVMATRNVRHFVDFDVEIVNPWQFGVPSNGE